MLVGPGSDEIEWKVRTASESPALPGMSLEMQRKYHGSSLKYVNRIREQLQNLGDNFVWVEAGSRNVQGVRTGS